MYVSDMGRADHFKLFLPVLFIFENFASMEYPSGNQRIEIPELTPYLETLQKGVGKSFYTFSGIRSYICTF